MATEAQLIGRVLEVLGVTPGSGQDFNSDDIARVQPKVAGVLEDLSLRNVTYSPDATSLADGALQWVATVIANSPELIGFYRPTGLPSAGYAEAMLRRQRMVETSDDHPKVCYF